MQESREHLAAAIRNEEFAAVLGALPERYAEWEVTALFYAALHYADAYLETQGRRPGDHSQRNRMVNSLTNAGGAYRRLFRLSLEARYELARFTPQEVDQIRDGPFRRVKEEMLSLLGI